MNIRKGYAMCDLITTNALKAGFYFRMIVSEHEKFTTFQIKFRLYEYMIMPFGSTNAPATF
jgi:hypothetical protein